MDNWGYNIYILDFVLYCFFVLGTFGYYGKSLNHLFLNHHLGEYVESELFPRIMAKQIQGKHAPTQPTDHLNFNFPTTYVIPKSPKVHNWLSQCSIFG